MPNGLRSEDRKEAHRMAAHTNVPDCLPDSSATQRSWLPQLFNCLATLVLVSLGVLL
jgi:hypothetical protein